MPVQLTDRRYLLLCVMGALLVLCSTLFFVSTHAAAAIDPKSPASDPPVLAQAKRLIDKGDAESASTMLRRYLATSPRPEYLDDTYLLLGAALLNMKEYPEALKVLTQLATEFPASELSDRGKVLLAQTHAAMGNIDLALPLLAQLRTGAADSDTKREARKLTAEFLAQKKDYVRAIQVLLEDIAEGTEQQTADTRDQIQELLTEKLDKKALIRVRDLYPRTFPGDLASIRLIEIYSMRGEDHLAERQIQQFLKQFPNHPYEPRATETLAQLKARLKANQYFIATVLPLSGRLAPFANEILEGIQLAVERAREQTGVPSVGLLVKDNESDRPSFLDDLSTLLTDDRPLAVIGPVLSKNLPVMAEMAERTRIPLITPAATFPNVRRLGGYVFSTTLTYALQAKRIADYATKEQEYRRFCILYPDTVYGREQARLFAQEIRQHDGEIIAMESFKEGDTDFAPQIKRLKEADLKKFGLAVPYDPSRPAGKPIGKNDKRILYTPGFDAIFIPSRASEIGLLAAQLAFHDVKVPLLGTNGWNSQDFLRTADRTVDGAVFVDGFFVDSPNSNVQDFVQRYQKRFSGTPTLFTMQGYDAARLVLEAVRHGATSGEAVRAFLSAQQDLPTLLGPAGFGPEGTLHRPLFLLQVKHGKFVQLD
ncbi:penicillin-binding protein activator [Nitrospira sp. NS4]|uniref:penicillin-binding protein activator n=1 Tax=Nitrospira sp. NS4 TaxID=3414498 RepID=UPI003C2F6B05